MCEFCKTGKEIFNNRKLNSKKNAYVGFMANIEGSNLHVFTCLEEPIILPLTGEVDIPINYCPMCGGKL